jgi:2-polyprenyl-3-methyl-5-hydroxy-6-metoxy-1,4-benzoquinol methylase
MAFFNRLRTRERIPERMDDPAIDTGEHRRALAALARINRLTNSAGVFWPVIRVLARESKRPIRLLDVATGSGDVPARLQARARRAGIDLEIAACDKSATAIGVARQKHEGIEFFVHDSLHQVLPRGFDLVTCSLFLHHLSNDEAIALLSNMENAARRLVLVNDLDRSRISMFAVWLACRVLTRSSIVRYDGPASVRSAFTAAEALNLAERCGLFGAVVKRRFPARFLLAWERR